MKLPLSNGGTQVHNTNLEGYSEPDALQVLIRSAHAAMEDDLERTEKSQDFTTDQFTISVGGVTCAFYLGGPQVEALYAFVDHICGENMYSFDPNALIVEGW